MSTANTTCSRLKLAIMRVLWDSVPTRRSRFEEALTAPGCPEDEADIGTVSTQAEAVLDAISFPTDDMILGGCLEANPIGALVDFDPDRCTTQEDVVSVYKAMIREGRFRENINRTLKK
ncbi:hypothetical protein G6L37_06775 [Agrobacterium rubi]|nr:hypothetical protein [Agrobacterium rubi]NTF25068.1 hypothetical protein [Agrobacterium rubi]